MKNENDNELPKNLAKLQEELIQLIYNKLYTHLDLPLEMSVNFALVFFQTDVPEDPAYITTAKDKDVITALEHTLAEIQADDPNVKKH